jgi:hypothetical protein
MLERFRPHLTYANTMSTLALFFAVSGSSYAAITINGASIKQRTIAGTKLRVNTVSGREVDESTLRQVPRARTVGGLTPAQLKLACPRDMFEIAGTCVERTSRPPTAYAGAVQQCAQAGVPGGPGRRLPTHGELMAALTVVQLASGGELTSNVSLSASDAGKLDDLYVTGRSGTTIALTPNTASGAKAYRCVTNRSN